ncbi:MAG: tRNA (adenosine(37)-N6)-threonylcarbamoyltransferase complex ATPase subunit type 1 TsaE [Cyanobacteriota bacterium]|nr:tRNA (adenosine(37)-N6)-threonylcarbamoyltransferase complex ATPase subunit type 1 TsaE [Cyanobacteriota bacterium]
MGGNNAIEVCQLNDADATRDLGRRLAERLLAGQGDGTPPLLLLQGDLGAGKTCLVQGLAEGLGLQEPITSPTFALAHHYPMSPSLTQRPQAAALVHLDLYRLDDPVAAAELFAQEEEEACALGAVLAVEWPERLAVQPRPCWLVELREAGEGREARVSLQEAPPSGHPQPSSRQARP